MLVICCLFLMEIMRKENVYEDYEYFKVEFC